MNKRYYTTDIIKEYISAQCDIADLGTSYPWQHGYALGLLSRLLNVSDPKAEIERMIGNIEEHLEKSK